MGGNGKHHRWKISFYHRSSSSPKPPPKEFLCPISGSLMFDPVVVSSGQTFERVSVQVCRDLGFTPGLEDGSTPDFTAIIPNLAMKTTILKWCDSTRSEHPSGPDYNSIENIVRSKMKSSDRPESSTSKSTPDIRFSERELLKGVAENPPVMFSHAVTEVNHRVNHFYSSSSEESVVVAPSSPLTPLPLATRPACYAYSTSSSSSAEITDAEALAQQNVTTSSPEEEELLRKMRSNDIVLQEEGVTNLRKLTKDKEDIRVSLCTPALLSALKPLIASRYSVVQTNAIASLVNLSLGKPNKVLIVRSGIVPLLIDVLKSGSDESQEHAAGALFSLALDDENKMAIGVLGALQPLMHTLRAGSERTRHDSALALYHLTLIQSNRVKLVKLNAVATLVTMVRSDESVSRILLILCNLAVCNEGRSAILDTNGVSILVSLLRERESESDATRENCVAALFALAHGNMRFRGLAKDAGAAEVLREVEERGSQRAREKAKRLLQILKGRKEEDDEDWEGVLDSGGMSQTRVRVGLNLHGSNSTNF
ncbi:U-box domain-containing protein 38-like [Mangifera indica]|uniref:U-box domain-containing protein 38-like n=1 Tax=Mangifera indica TaxID=29780 RepID=UPI001CFC0576|nr:U-box domain-containing protein 38-like [Mangifera indica]